MSTYIALLRGINVSGKRKVVMAELRKHLETLGLEQVQTYIQSGNIIFQSSQTDTKRLEELIHACMEKEYGFDVPAWVLTREELETVIRENPFADVELKTVHVTYLGQVPDQEKIDLLQAVHHPPDRFIYTDKRVYLHCPNGYGRSKLTNSFWEKKLATKATTRNWKTTVRLAEMAQEYGKP